MKFLFIYPSSENYLISSKVKIKSGSFLPPLGILYLAKIIENKGHDVEVIDFNAEEFNEEKLKEKVLSSDAVGMTLYSGQIILQNSIKLSKIIKDCDPDIPFLIGGPHCSLVPETAMRDFNADICIKGEADNIIGPLTDALEGKKDLKKVNGIFYREGKKIKKTKPSKKAIDLDDIPFPARHLVEKYEYGFISNVRMAYGKPTSFMASRGCPHNCSFCMLRSHLSCYKRRSLENIKQELKEVFDQGYQSIFFVDDNFLVNKKEIMKMMDFIKEQDRDVRMWILDARVDSADRELYEKMRDAGIEAINFGIESGNKDVLEFYNKKITLDQVRKAVKLSKKMGFFTTASFIFGAPIEKKKHIFNTIEFAKSIPLDGVSFFPLGYGRGAPIWDEAVKNGKIKPEEYFVFADKNRGLGNFSSEELKEFTSEAYRQFYFTPRLWMRHFSHAVQKGDLRFLRLGLNMFSGG